MVNVTKIKLITDEAIAKEFENVYSYSDILVRTGKLRFFAGVNYYRACPKCCKKIPDAETSCVKHGKKYNIVSNYLTKLFLTF